MTIKPPNAKSSATRAAAGSQYALIVGLVGVIALAAVAGLGTNIKTLLTRFSNTVNAVQAPPVTVTQSGPAPVDAVYYQCGGLTTYIAFVKNVDNQSINNLTTNVSACQHYGFKALGITNPTYRSDRGFGDAENASMSLAVDCANCFWGDGGNPWYFHRSGGNVCTWIQGTAPAGARVAGMAANITNTAMNCATIKQTLGSGINLTQNSSSTAHPFYSVSVSGTPNTDPNCTARTSTNITGQFSGVPEYILCASPSILP